MQPNQAPDPGRAQSGKIGRSPVSIGRFTYGFANIAVKQWGEGAALHIGQFCSIAEKVTVFLGGNHRTDWVTTFPFGHIFQDQLGGKGIQGHPNTHGDVHIGNDVWLGSGATLMSGITVGHGAVIAANAVVVKNVAPYEIVGGNPAQHIKFRFSPEQRAQLLTLRWWDLPLEAVRTIAAELSSPPSDALLAKLLSTYRQTPHD